MECFPYPLHVPHITHPSQKEPIEIIWKGEVPSKRKVTGWLVCPSHSKQAKQISSLPNEQVGNSPRLPIGVMGDTWHMSPPRGYPCRAVVLSGGREESLVLVFGRFSWRHFVQCRSNCHGCSIHAAFTAILYEHAADSSLCHNYTLVL